ncbi:post-GPI attachment to proteins factor 3 precursor [Obelidium mucronatum]|nr:post-GPI attachment to proteins factor 3 precursor [Obelidium mucronatum]
MKTLLLVLLVVALVYASTGDRQPIYQQCVRSCKSTGCSEPLPLELRLTFWDCDANCRYECTHKTTRMFIEAGHGIHQFHGKWPFIRWRGLQEPASVLFSILNGLMHYLGFRKLRKVQEGRAADLRMLYMVNALLGVQGWFWSAIFHSRDTPFTEKMDYFSAVLSITLNAYIALVKTFNLSRPENRGFRALLRLVAIGFYVCHVTYLTLWPFDYGYNMIAGITVGMISNFSWLYWCISKRTERPYTWKMSLFVVLLMGAMSLEVLDFPPFMWILDAHALWHAATVPLVYLYYLFFVDDLRYEAMNRAEGAPLRAGKSASKIV